MTQEEADEAIREMMDLFGMPLAEAVQTISDAAGKPMELILTATPGEDMRVRFGKPFIKETVQ